MAIAAISIPKIIAHSNVVIESKFSPSVLMGFVNAAVQAGTHLTIKNQGYLSGTLISLAKAGGKNVTIIV